MMNDDDEVKNSLDETESPPLELNPKIQESSAGKLAWYDGQTIDSLDKYLTEKEEYKTTMDRRVAILNVVLDHAESIRCDGVNIPLDLISTLDGGRHISFIVVADGNTVWHLLYDIVVQTTSEASVFFVIEPEFEKPKTIDAQSDETHCIHKFPMFTIGSPLRGGKYTQLRLSISEERYSRATFKRISARQIRYTVEGFKRVFNIAN